jgi:hypothetical protein
MILKPVKVPGCNTGDPHIEDGRSNVYTSTCVCVYGSTVIFLIFPRGQFLCSPAHAHEAKFASDEIRVRI